MLIGIIQEVPFQILFICMNLIRLIGQKAIRKVPKISSASPPYD